DEVKKDQVLALLDISDLKTTLNQLKNELATIQKLEGAHRDRYSIEVRRMALQLQNEAADLVERLSLIESQSAELAALNAEIKRLTNAEAAGLGRSRELSALMLQRDALHTYLKEQSKDIEFQRRNLEKARQSRAIFERADIDDMANSLLTEQMQYAEELRRLVAETEYRISLRTILAPCDGYVTDILARQGDAVDAFIPIFAVEETAPAFLEVYISDKSDLVPQVGMKVDIYSSRRKEFNTTGTISFVHPGFSMLSERFSYRGQFLWARKVQVELPKEHQLIPGEVVKVRVHNDSGDKGYITLTAAAANSHDAHSPSAKHPPLLSMELPAAYGQFSSSGVAWIPDDNRYLIAVSDDAAKDPQTYLFYMDEEGTVDTTPVSVAGVKDVKAITSAEDGMLYLVASLNVQEGDKTVDREYIVRMKRDDNGYIAHGQLQILSSLLALSPQQLAALGLAGIERDELSMLSVTGATFHDKALFLALNRPKSPKGVMVWRLHDVDAVFNNQKLQPNQISLYGHVQLASGENAVDIIDIAFDRKGTLWASSTTTDDDQENQAGGLYRIDMFADGHLQATQVFRFPGMQPEGMCLQKDGFTIVFNDETDRPMFCSIDAEEL
ncbi:HlyD family efflux transporter periplasmic adaptor subunit, partial [candidate division KSB1 bacterium]|nr:HlyD family efflux transporter periplasmic adaptor subunit [candidate division KSB1 bacterium]